jgi:hypothetical protein
MECVLKNYQDLELFPNNHMTFFSHDKPIPDAQNYLVEKALDTDCTHFWFVEEDNTFPIGILFKMLAKDAPVVALDYPVGEKKYSTIMKKDGEIWWTGLGCTLFKREVFETLDAPWFTTDTTWRITNAETMELVKENIPNKYGGHDINLGMRLREEGIPIVSIEGITGGHLEIVDERTDGSNSGGYTIREHNDIYNYQVY